tara:strand:- start:1436 stop:5032 length:3597 start_codon:yes stop_codon:yes gene_type:complete
MKPTKKTENQVIEVYSKWVHSYLNGDVKTYDSYLDDAYHFIGSTQNEEFLNRRDTTHFFANTADQLAGKCNLRNETKTIEQFGKLVFITHLFDAWFLNEKEFSYYGRFRFTSTLQEKAEGWRFIYQHFSTPDAKTEVGETIGFDKISKENTVLKEAIKRRTVELETKNRALEIEGALQRIRAQAVAMKESTDLLDIVVTMRTEFIKLGYEAHYFWHMMWLPETYEKAMSSGDGTKIGFVMELPRHIHGDISLLAEWEKSTVPTVVYAMNAEEAIDYVDKMVRLGDFKNIDPQAPTHDDIKHLGGLTFIMARTSHGEIGYSLPGIVKNPPKEDLDILIQFAGAFDLAHRRFLDLQKAEQQARETQIELALEKVRSRTMAMQHSNELAETSFLLDSQVRGLGIKTRGCAFNIYNENDSTEWFSSEQGTMPTYQTPRENIFLEYYEIGKRGQSMHIQNFEGEVCAKHYEYMCTLPVMGDALKKLKESGGSFPVSQIDHVIFFKYGYLLFITLEPVPEAHDIFMRFANVFEQTYTRFLDLQKAEAQAREAQIEHALEKVRSRTMAMQQSNELPEAANDLFLQVQALGIPAWSAGYCIWDKDKTNATANMSSEGVVQKPFVLPIVGEGYDFKKPLQNGESFHIDELGGDAIVKHYEFMRTLPIFGEVIDGILKAGFPLPTFQIFHIVYFDYGYVMFITYEPVPKAHEIFKRFGKVFEQTYTRFLDLQKAEAQIKEAQIEAALETVRSRSLSMQKPHELQEVVAVVSEKLKDLGIVMDAGGVIICTYFKDSKDVVHWIASPDYSHSGKYLVPYFDHQIFRDSWESKNNGDEWFSKSYSVKEKNSFFTHCFEHSDYKHFPEEIKELVLKKNHHTLSFAWNQHSAILVPSHTKGLIPSQMEQEILIRFAKVFEQAFIRFMDLQMKEEQSIALIEEKQRLEKTLKNLQETQKQLIQSEKMASLGELTAGIAHEIQNPLNFVNNFSEVSNELIDEMNEELDKGDLEEVKAISLDIKQNLEKINHHGKRADNIVKGMLQHSRSSSGTKEPTDINALADEYLRLAYHGLRAKDKSFNAELITNFDESIGKVNIVPQDMGRVILNLITNAFYAVNEKKQKNTSFKPIVSLSSKNLGKHISISVSDNGDGIPEKFKEKIFQPFFTSKPTGQGTGLGLSMSYDIVSKGHGGELKVESNEGEGTTFIINLKIND